MDTEEKKIVLSNENNNIIVDMENDELDNKSFEDDNKVIVIGSRKSKLAMTQTLHVIDELKKIYPDHVFHIKEQDTIGDRILNVPLAKIGDKGLFTQELEERILNGQIDFAVHSLKDMPTNLPEGLTLGCITKREDPIDVVLIRPDLVKLGFKSLNDLNNSSNPDHFKIGTSSLRRQALIYRKYKNLQCIDIRGNLDTRIQKLNNTYQEVVESNVVLKEENDTDDKKISDSESQKVEYAAIVLALAGLKRQGETYTQAITEYLNADDMYYAVGQGALGIECRSNDERILNLLNSLNDPQTSDVCKAERAFMRKLEGGCHAPIGVKSLLMEDVESKEITDIKNKIRLQGIVLSNDGKEYYEYFGIGDGESLGVKVAEHLIAQGASKLLLPH